MLFFDTTCTYFVTEDADDPVPRDERGSAVPGGNAGAGEGGKLRTAGFRTCGKSKDSPRRPAPGRDRDGRHPGRHPSARLVLAREHRRLRLDPPGQATTCGTGPYPGSCGSPTAASPPLRTAVTCARAANHYIIGEKLRSGSAEAEAALSRQGRYQEVAENLRVKEVSIAEDERFVICYNPEGAERDAAIRARLIAQLKELTDGTDKLARDKRAELRGVISTRPGLNRYLRVTPGGLLRVDAGRVRAEENLDGKYLLRTSDPKMTAEDIALGYRQLLEVERGKPDCCHKRVRLSSSGLPSVSELVLAS